MQATNEDARIVSMLSFNPFTTVVFTKAIHNNGGAKRNENSMSNLQKTKFNGQVSTAIQKRIKTAIGWMCLRVAYQVKKGKRTRKQLNKLLSFITLTLPSKQQHTDNEIKEKCLNQLLIELRRQWGVKQYVWKAEAQANGNIHFHLVVDKYIPKADLQHRWNRIVDKLGYHSEYQKKHGQRQAPSTEIKNLKHVRKCAAYIAKYCSKAEGKRPIKGRVWYASENLQNIEKPSIEIDSELNNILSEIESAGTTKLIYKDHATVICKSIFETNFLNHHLVNQLLSRFIDSFIDLNFQNNQNLLYDYGISGSSSQQFRVNDVPNVRDISSSLQQRFDFCTN